MVDMHHTSVRQSFILWWIYAARICYTVVMPDSPRRHTLALLRLALSQTQGEFEALLGCSRPTIQAIELGKLRLSQKLAQRVAEQTGVDLHWLLENDTAKPMKTPDGQDYTPAVFHQTQSQLKRGSGPLASTHTFCV